MPILSTIFDHFRKNAALAEDHFGPARDQLAAAKSVHYQTALQELPQNILPAESEADLSVLLYFHRTYADLVSTDPTCSALAEEAAQLKNDRGYAFRRAKLKAETNEKLRESFAGSALLGVLKTVQALGRPLPGRPLAG